MVDMIYINMKRFFRGLNFELFLNSFLSLSLDKKCTVLLAAKHWSPKSVTCFVWCCFSDFPAVKWTVWRLNILHNVNISDIWIWMFLGPLFQVHGLVNFVVLEFVSYFHIHVKWTMPINKVLTCANIFFQISVLGFLSTENVVLFSWIQSFLQNIVLLGDTRAILFLKYRLC